MMRQEMLRKCYLFKYGDVFQEDNLKVTKKVISQYLVGTSKAFLIEFATKAIFKNRIKILFENAQIKL